MINAQIWLNQNISTDQRGNIQKLLISIPSQQNTFVHLNFYRDFTKYYLPNNLNGELNLSTFPNLTHLIIEYQGLTSLDLNSNQQLRDIDVSNNLLQTVTFPRIAPQLDRISVINNNLRPQDLTVFANYPDLKNLILGTNDTNRIQQGLYNRWQGSLFPLRNLTILEELDINSTNIFQGLQFLSLNNLHSFTCGDKGRNDALVNNIKWMLGFSEEIAIEEIDPITMTNKVQQISNWQQVFRNQQLIAQIQQTYFSLNPRNN